MHSFLQRFKLAALASSLLALAFLTWHTTACVSASTGVVGASCTSTSGCITPEVCLPINATTTACSPDAGINTVYTCQQPCMSQADCEILSSPPTYTCSMALAKCAMASGQPEVCIPNQ
jgi:hypothetical protein